VRRVPGRCLAITSDWATRNYAHFVADALPRIRLAEMTGSGLSTFDRFIVEAPNAACLAMLQRLGIPRELMVEPRDGVALQPDVLVAATLPGVRRGMPGWAAAFLRERLGRRGSQARRLYIARSSRKPINDDALIEIARQHGFETYRPEDDLAGQIETFASAAVVVGAHGAALVNLVFARPETRVLELVPTDHVFPYYLAISEAAGLHYGYLAGPSLEVRADNEIGPSASDFLVDAGEFRSALDVLVS
jgi:capsular polysaccharide biosynthesis protein